jgi:mRNA interferase MazF
MAAILRGEVRWAQLNPIRGREQSGLRPVLVLSHDIFNHHSGTVIAMAITSKLPRASFPMSFELKTAKLPKQSWVITGQIRTLSVERIGKLAGKVSNEELSRVIEGLNEIID